MIVNGVKVMSFYEDWFFGYDRKMRLIYLDHVKFPASTLVNHKSEQKIVKCEADVYEAASFGIINSQIVAAISTIYGYRK